jgi:hypothetical protein
VFFANAPPLELLPHGRVARWSFVSRSRLMRSCKLDDGFSVGPARSSAGSPLSFRPAAPAETCGRFSHRSPRRCSWRCCRGSCRPTGEPAALRRSSVRATLSRMGTAGRTRLRYLRKHAAASPSRGSFAARASRPRRSPRRVARPRHDRAGSRRIDRGRDGRHVRRLQDRLEWAMGPAWWVSPDRGPVAGPPPLLRVATNAKELCPRPGVRAVRLHRLRRPVARSQIHRFLT